MEWSGAQRRRAILFGLVSIGIGLFGMYGLWTAWGATGKATVVVTYLTLFGLLVAPVAGMIRPGHPWRILWFSPFLLGGLVMIVSGYTPFAVWTVWPLIPLIVGSLEICLAAWGEEWLYPDRRLSSV